MLKIEQLHTHYGALHILKGVTMQVDEGQLVCLIGANGAGKSTLLKAISGLIHPTSGNIVYNGVSLNKLAPPDIVRLGITHVPEGRLVFPGVTVRVNLEMGAFLRKDKQGIVESFERVYTLFPRLKERSKQQAQTLSGGEQQMLAIARGLMANPKMLLLDEPSLGLAPVLVDQVADTIKE
ncbi:MAG: ABC transporter ATP-binding protein, partial [Dehalococcoidales bacterium]|nr:ABC transporter ATP-binding protein [Dehalococcoidales bacterium]